MSEGSIWEGTDEQFAGRLQAMIAASGGRISVISAYRSVERQAQLYEEGKRKYGDQVNRWVAPPGRSNHNHGLAVDLRYVNDEAKEWAHQNAARFGLMFPMDHEPWHIEPIGVRDGTYRPGQQIDYDAYTEPPPGVANGWDKPRTFEDQMLSVIGMLMNPLADPALEAPTAAMETDIGSFDQPVEEI